MIEHATADEIDEGLRALSHQARRAILRLTTTRAVAATELAERLELAPATVSEHLRVLRKTGLVQLTATGTWRHYRADLDRVTVLLDAVGKDLLPPHP